MKLSLTLAATLSLIGAVHAQRPSIVKPTFPRPAQSLGSFLQADEPTPTEIGMPEPRTDDNTATPGASPESDIESRPLSKLSAGQTGTAKPLQPEKLIPSVAMNLAVVIGTMVLLAFAWKTLKKSPRRSKSPVESESGLPTRLEVEDQLRLAGGQILYSVRHGGRAFLIGSTPQSISLLADLSAPRREAHAHGSSTDERRAGRRASRAGRQRRAASPEARAGRGDRARGERRPLLRNSGPTPGAGERRRDRLRPQRTRRRGPRRPGPPPLSLRRRLPVNVKKLLAVALGICLVASPALAQAPTGIPIGVKMPNLKQPQETAQSLQILAMLTVLAVAPGILMMMTSFTRIVIVLGLTRSAMGTQQLPPNQVLMGLALCLTFFTMQPTLSQINTNALQPYLTKQISADQAAERAVPPIRGFMLHQTREADLALFVEMSRIPRPATVRDIPTYVIIPAFVVSELKTGFMMGFVIMLPFLVVDLVVSLLLMSMGMMMVPPMQIALPFKILLFVLIDGWHLLARALALSF